MLFPSEVFLFAFLPVVIVVYYVLLRRNVLLKNIWLLVASLCFYAYGEPVYVFLMIGVIIFNYFMGLFLDARKNDRTVRKIGLIAAVIVNIGVLGVFKYASFIDSEILKLTGNSRDALSIALPIGISFFTFQAMSYVIDVYRGEVAAEKNPLYVGLYVSFFPQLIAGPIVRYQTVHEQMRNRSENWDDFSYGVVRFLRGLVKKVLIANNMALVADAAFELIIDGRLEASVCMAWLGAISYTLQIFFDFSGYSDMAIGLGRMFGFKFLENFDHPYIAGSVTEFWRRWHISLSAWFRDYVYIPLGGSRKGTNRTIINLLIVWLLTGVWHGANWTFLVWGLLYFVALTIEKLCGVKVGKRTFAGHIYTMIIVIIAWVIFRANSLGDAWVYVKGMFGFGSGMICDKAVLAYLRHNAIYYVLAVIGCFPILSFLENRFKDKQTLSVIYNTLYVLVVGIMAFISLSFIINNAYSPFIYFNF